MGGDSDHPCAVRKWWLIKLIGSLRVIGGWGVREIRGVVPTGADMTLCIDIDDFSRTRFYVLCLCSFC